MRKHAVPLTVALISLFILLLGWGNYLFLKIGAEHLVLAVEKIQTSVEAEDWDMANSLLSQTESAWQKTRVYWPIMVHHAEMDRIEECINRLKSFLVYEKKADALAEIYQLIYSIKHIPEKEAFTLQNIF